ncbi:NADH:flavin oxidoreductase / NADH oxidase family protein [Sarocladium implicatum]|nr:NADH:flavin oxidoreductase / NADH oxidase family protein [Sarocladium implicatum]
MLEVLSTERLLPRHNSSPQSVQLSILDSACARFSPTGAIWLYDHQLAAPKDLLQQLQSSFELALTRFPHFAGQLCWASSRQNGHATHFGRATVTFGSAEDPGVEWTTARLHRKASDLVPDASDRANAKVWLGTGFPQKDLMASKTPLALGDLKTFENLPAMMVQVTLLEDAFAVAIKLAHPLADASTLVLFAQHWAEVSRAQHSREQGPTTLETPVFDPQMLDKRARGGIEDCVLNEEKVRLADTLPLHRYDWWATDAEGYPPFMMSTSENSKPADPALRREAIDSSGEVPPWKTWDFSRSVTHAIIHFTPEQVDELRARVNQDAQRCSRLDAVLANIWSAINRSRGLSESQEKVFLNMTMGVRARVDPPLPAGFAGSPLVIANTNTHEQDGIPRRISALQATAAAMWKAAQKRLAKAAMSDSLGDGRGNPSDEQVQLYQRWATGGVALSIVGEVQADPNFAEKPGNLVLDDRSQARSADFKRLAAAGSVNNSSLWLQIGQAGAMAYPPISTPKGPSALDLPGLRCGELSVAEIQQIPSNFARTAKLAQEYGFGGVEVHAAHGFLLSQFLSPLFNKRTDDYGGCLANRLRLLLEAIQTVRDAVGPDFPIGVKINSSDQLEGGLSQDEAMQVVAELDRTSIDLIDISGGTYFPGARSASDASASGPYFLDFAKKARAKTSKPLMVVGGFKTAAQAIDAVQSTALDVVGLARALILYPSLPNAWMSGAMAEPSFPRFEAPPEGAVTAWYTMRMLSNGESGEGDGALDATTALAVYNDRDKQREAEWKQMLLECKE